jgi:hypothetical protein
MTYSKKLKDPRWQKKRLEILNRDDFTCTRCCDSENPLSVHHLRYFPNVEPWDVPDKDLITLCESCHDYEYQYMPDAEREVVTSLKCNGFLAMDIQQIASGFNSLHLSYPPEVMASIIEYILSNYDLMKHCGDMYFDFLREKNGKSSD